MNPRQTNATVETALEAQVASVVALIEEVQTPKTQRRAQAMSLNGPTPPGAGGGTNVYLPNGNSYTPPDYGSNLWISQFTITNGYLTGMASNTVSGVPYELLSNGEIGTTNWVSTGLFLYGSETTNWTALPPVPVSRTNHLFFKLRSDASSDGNLPDWFEQQYGVTDPYGDPDGDGWNNLQELQNGTSPLSFDPPPAPQGLAVAYHSASGAANLRWLPAAGAVTGYTVKDSAGHAFNVAANTTTLSQTVPYAPDFSYYSSGDPTMPLTYQVQAHYAGGDSAWSASVPLQPATVQGRIVPTPTGGNWLTVADLPAAAVAVRIVQFFNGTYLADNMLNPFAIVTNLDLPVNGFTNGICPVAGGAFQPTVPPYPIGVTNHSFYLQAVDAAGNVSGGSYLGESWEPAPFTDGRAHLKQNLIFQLRAAFVDRPFHYLVRVDYSGVDYRLVYGAPTNYVYSGFYNTWTYDDGTDWESDFIPEQPFGENAFYRNFAFDPAAMDTNGWLATGLGDDENGTYPFYANGQEYDYPNYDLSFHKPWVNPMIPWVAPLTYQVTLPLQTSPSALLGTNETRWLMGFPRGLTPGLFPGYEQALGLTWTYDGNWLAYYTLASGTRNCYGLPYLSALLAYRDQDYDGHDLGLTTTLLPAGGTTPGSYGLWNPVNIYLETAAPQLQTVEYDFFTPDWTWNAAAQTNVPPLLPGTPGFSPAAVSPQLFAAVGNQTRIAAYAKLAVTNAYPGIYAYLGQYFDRAYQITNGVVTTNRTGVLSPYGNFFATEAGPAALVTLPDLDTGERGTGFVYCVALQVDKNHDGSMDLSWNGPDATSPNSPYVFWRNNNFDRWKTSYAGVYTDVEQDDQLAEPCEGAHGLYLTDCDFVDYEGRRAIPCTRDLEDYARLWVGGITPDLVSNLPAGSTITLSWGDMANPNPNPSNPTIDVFAAVEADGGIGYLTNSLTASNQVAFATTNYIGRLAPGQSLPLYSGAIASWRGSHYLWCGVSNGIGQLTLTIADGQGNMLAQTSVAMQIKDIKQLYERWTVGDNPGEAPRSVPILSAENLPAGNGRLFQYDRPPDTSTPYILHVHGYNMPTWAKDRFAETAYKRLYWQGYQGLFGAFNWPTAANALQFGGSESQAWLSARGLLNKLEDLDDEYPGNVYLTVHSLGNVVAGEALRLAGTNQVVNTYIAMQGAVTAHAYDPNTTPYTLTADWGAPDCYAHYWTNGAPCYFNGSAGAGTYVNFYNTNDWALRVAWLTFQNSKPILDLNYSFTPPDRYFKNSGSTELFFPADTYELFDEIIQSRSYALGMQKDVGGAFQKSGAAQEIDLQSVWPPDPLADDYKAHVWHSAEFRSDSASRWGFWRTVLQRLDLTP